MNNPINPSWRHHYLPQFYLRAWTDSDGLLWAHREPRSGTSTVKRCAPKAVGFEENLYTASDLIFYEEMTDSVETKFLKDLDNDAAPVHRKLLNDDSELSGDERRTWAQFVYALYKRSPRVLREQREPARRVIQEVWSDLIRTAPDADSQIRMREVKQLLDDQLAAEWFILENMVRAIKDPKVADGLCRLSWTLFKVNDGFRLLTGENALVINWGKTGPPVELLTLAPSPTSLFVMHPSSWTVDSNDAWCILQVHNFVVFQESRLVVSDQQLQGPALDRLRSMAQKYAEMRMAQAQGPTT
jgi:hypothetical protein